MKIEKETIEINRVLFEAEKPIYVGKNPKECKNDIDIYMYCDDRNYKMIIATLHWNEKETRYELVSVGMRLAEYGSTELLGWLFEISIKYEELLR